MSGPTREQMDRVVNMIMYGRNKTFRTAASKIVMGKFFKRGNLSFMVQFYDSLIEDEGKEDLADAKYFSEKMQTIMKHGNPSISEIVDLLCEISERKPCN